MKIYYFDKDSKFMEMTVDDKPIVIPYIVRVCNAINTARFIIAETNDEIADMYKKIRKSPDKFVFHMGTLTLTGDNPSNVSSWTLSDIPDFGDYQSSINIAKSQSVEFFVRTRCDISQLSSMEKKSHLGNSFYYKDVTLTKFSNAQVHLFGKCQINVQGLTNCLVYMHDDII